MQALSIAFHAIVPLFLIIALGFGVKRLGWIGPEDVRRFNKVCFYTFMPVMLFYNIYTSDFSHAVRLPYALFVVGMALAMTAAPIAVNSFNMAQQLGGDSELAGSAVVISTAGSFFTLFLWITLFKQLDMF